jgi:hypothetical protein
MLNQITDIVESLPPEKSEKLVIGDMLSGNGLVLKKNKANKAVQATAEMKH